MSNLMIAGPLPTPATPVQVALRPFLADATYPEMPATLQEVPTKAFPLVLQPIPDAMQAHIPIADWAADAKVWIEVNLHQCGAMLLCGLPLVTADDFLHFTSGLEYEPMSYASGTAVRHHVTASVMTASDEPPDFNIEPHNEMAYARIYPSKILFFCETPPDEGGETPIVDVRQYEKRIASGLRDKIQQTGIRYLRHLVNAQAQAYTSWQNAFFTDDQQEVETFCRAHNYDFHWDRNHNLTYNYVLPATHMHPKTGEEVWFNQIAPHHGSYFRNHPNFIDANQPLHTYPFHCQYGDGTEFLPEEIADIRTAVWSSAIAVPWCQGDILILDNMLVQYGRMSYEGKRRILVSIVK